MKKKFAALTLCVLISGATSGQVLVVGSAEAGKSKAVVCGACHGPDGNSVNPVWPSIAGQHPAYIVNQLQAFKSGTRTEPLMLGQAMLLSDEDMRNLAVYFSEMTTATKKVIGNRILRRSITAKDSIVVAIAKTIRQHASPVMAQMAVAILRPPTRHSKGNMLSTLQNSFASTPAACANRTA